MGIRELDKVGNITDSLKNRMWAKLMKFCK